MSINTVTLFDIPSKDGGCTCWSLNTWKIRLALNYKGIEYETEWLEYPEIAPTLERFGLKPWSNEGTRYTVPAVRFTDKTYAMNSVQIIQEIEKRYCFPDYPALFPGDPMSKRAQDLVYDLFDDLEGVLLPKVANNILNDASAEFFRSTRQGWLGMTLEDFAGKRGGDEAWLESKEKFGNLAEMLRENDGIFFLGSQISWADIIVVSFLHFLKRVVGDDEFGRLAEWPPILTLYEALSQWLQRDSE